MPNIEIDPHLCIKCGSCALVCPEGIFIHDNKAKPPRVSGPERCIACGQCAAACPEEAITHEKFPKGTMKYLNRKILPTEEQVLEAIRGRRSIRSYIDQEVEKSKIEKIIDAARLAPSAKNKQSTSFIVVQDKENLKKVSALTVRFLAKIAKKLKNPLWKGAASVFAKARVDKAMLLVPSIERIVKAHKQGEDRILRNAPCAVFFYGKKTTAFAAANANLCQQNATFMTQALGLGTFYTGYVVAACGHDRSIPKLLGVPDDYDIFAGMTLGYPKFGRFPYWIERNAPKITWL
jgi:nitroreductase/NAD-dependent dihydropyrimidine dehydrogenase PreA subunit